MPTSKPDQEFADYIVDLMQPLGPVCAKRMFGGYGLYLDGLMFALIANGELYLKADKQTACQFEARGLAPFTYHKKDKPVSLSYYRAPEETLEDAEQMRYWAGQAHAVAGQAAAEKRRE